MYHHTGFTGCGINRQGKNYIGLEIEDKKFRMKGAVYGKDFRDIREVRRKQEELQAKHIPSNDREFEKIEQELEEIISYQAKQNQEKYNHLKYNHNDIDIIKHSNLHADEQVASADAREIRIRSSKISKNKSEKNVPGRQSRTLQTRRLENDELREQINRITRAREARERERDARIAFYAAYNRKTARTDTQSITRQFKELTEQQRRLQRDRKSLKFIAKEFFRRVKSGIVEIIEYFKKPKEQSSADEIQKCLKDYVNLNTQENNIEEILKEVNRKNNIEDLET